MASQSGEAPRVVIVDEAGAERQKLTQIVTDAGLTATVMPTSDEALELIRKEVPDIVITDLLAPRINGWDLVEHLEAEYPDVRVVVMTARISDALERMLIERSVDGYVLKPFNERRVKALLRLLSKQARTAQREVVLVDGDRAQLAQATPWLEAREYVVHAYHHMPEAEADVKSSPPDLVVVDRHVGPFDGLAMVRDLRQAPWTDHIPILLTGASLSRADIGRAVAAKVNGVLMKPYTEAQLVERVERLLGQGKPPEDAGLSGG